MNRIILENQPKSPAQWLRSVDWLLLGFLLLFTLDSVVAKPVAIALAGMFLLPRLGAVKFKDAPPFYLLLPAMELLRFFLLNDDFSKAHFITLLIGCAYWIMAWLGFVFTRDRVEKSGWDRVTGTLDCWFVINVLVSLFQLLMAMKNTGTLNPYTSTDLKYGNSTGDFINGILLAPCYFNMFISSFFAVWYLFRGRWAAALIASLICYMTTSNFANIIFIPVLLMLLFVLKQKAARLCILGCLGIFAGFSFFVSSGNIRYLKESMENTAGESITANQKPSQEPNPPQAVPAAQEPVSPIQEIPQGADSAPAAAIIQPPDSAQIALEQQAQRYQRLARPNGKFLSWKETWAYFKSSPPHALIGAGIGNFSSLLALQMAHVYGRHHSRFYEQMPTYIHPDYQNNHLQIMSDVYGLPEGYHSARHMVHSFPNQIVGEYGLLGVLFFLFGYVWYFLKRVRFRGYFAVIFVLTAGYLWFDYLFDYLSVMVFFELFFLIYRSQSAKNNAHG